MARSNRTEFRVENFTSSYRPANTRQLSTAAAPHPKPSSARSSARLQIINVTLVTTEDQKVPYDRCVISPASIDVKRRIFDMPFENIEYGLRTRDINRFLIYYIVTILPPPPNRSSFVTILTNIRSFHPP